MRKTAIALILWLLCSLIWYFNAKSYVGTLDFLQYWAAIKLLLSNQNPYDTTLLLEIQQGLWSSQLPFPIILYCPPVALTFLLPLALVLDFHAAAGLWNGLSLLVLIFGIRFLSREYSFSKEQNVKLIAFALTFTPIYTLLFYGQVSHLLLLGLLLMAVVFLRQEWGQAQRWLIALGLALSTIKPHLFYLLYLFLAIEVFKRRDTQLVLVSSLCLIAVALVPAIFHSSVWLDYFRFMQEPPIQWKTPTIGYWLQHFMGVESVAVRISPVVIGLTFAIFLYAKLGSSYRLFLCLLPLSLITSPYGWLFDQVLLLPVILFLMQSRLLFYILIAMNLLMMFTPKAWGQEYFIWYPICIFVLVLLSQFLHSESTSSSSSDLGTKS